MRLALAVLGAALALAGCGGSSSSASSSGSSSSGASSTAASSSTASSSTASSSTASSSSYWKQLRSVRITVSRPGLPPPGGLPKTKVFATPAQVAHVTAALNAHHIVKTSGSSSNGCAGGYQITVVIEPQHSAPVRLAAYRCASQTSGNIGGDVAGFLSSIGIAS